uniref:THAP-type domain-containing protein n=1 Tax=Pectinophora gossypiella TaxID=13191 RepID=A0A1E1WCR1_PECGO
MGGCKCTYRNCTIKSDGQTHMFHYPVFDKVRCHQWLTNAQRLDFLELKVSQLKNRVICQHHFLPDNFMNYKMDKLRHNAVPTENGPFCGETDLVSDNYLNQEIDNIMYPITVEDIVEEIDQTLAEKKVSLSFKYGDFLVNSEPVPKQLISVSKNNTSHSNSMKKIKKDRSIDISDSVLQLLSIDHVNKISLPSESKEDQALPHPMLVISPYCDYPSKIAYENSVKEEPTHDRGIQLVTDSNTPLGNSQRNNKIKIISEKKIEQPFTIKGKMKPVPATLVICGSNTKENNVQHESATMQNIEHMEVIISNPPENSYNIINSQISNEPAILDPQDMHLKNQILVDDLKQTESNHIVGSINIIEPQDHPRYLSSKPKTHHTPQIQRMGDNNTQIAMNAAPKRNNQEEKPSKSPHKVSILKPNIPPERVAKIQEKRKFNKKIRDMIEFCLDELDEPGKPNNESNKLQNTGVTRNQQKSKEASHSDKISQSIKPQNKTKQLKQIHVQAVKDKLQKDVKKENESLSVTTFLSKEPSLPSASDYNVAFLEARLKQMEENLLKKIDQNAKRIYDLKHTVADSPNQIKEWKSVVTQTNDDEESHKKHLFQEISRYLSPESKSIIYEELFLSIYAKKKSKQPSIKSQTAKKRKRR